MPRRHHHATLRVIETHEGVRPLPRRRAFRPTQVPVTTWQDNVSYTPKEAA